MPKYAISPEGADELNKLAAKILACVSDTLDKGNALSKLIDSLDESLGVFSEDIRKVIHSNYHTVRLHWNEIVGICTVLKSQANEITRLYGSVLSANTGGAMQLGGYGNSRNNAFSDPPSARRDGRKPQYTNINDIPENEYNCITDYNTDSGQFNNAVRAGMVTKQTKLLSKMIQDRVLYEPKKLYRRGTIADLNDLSCDPDDPGDLAGKEYTFCGFMSTSPSSKLVDYVSHHNVFFEFDVSAGVNALDLSSLMYNEVIFDSPQCKIQSAERRGNDIYIVGVIK